MEEIWKDIRGFNGIYQVSNLGRVRSLDRITIHPVCGKRRFKGILLKLQKDKDGYPTAHLRDAENKKNRLMKVHRLVAEAFLEKVEGKEQIDHINGVRDDNRAENLRYCTSKENNNFPLAKINRSIAITQSYINNPELRKIRAVIFRSIRRKSHGC